jgi:hypothetical protein
MMDTPPCMGTEPEQVLMPIKLQGAGAAVPTRLAGRNNYTLTRTAAGVIKIQFSDDPGPGAFGIVGFTFGDPTVANVAGWSVTETTPYTPRSGATPAFLVFTIANAANAAADLAATSTLGLILGFKQAASTTE